MAPKILDCLLNLIKTDASNHIKNCGQLFTVITRFAELGLEQCRHLFKMDFFSVTMKLLLGVGMEETSWEGLAANRNRKWASSQNRELADLHSMLATLILACDTTEHHVKRDSKFEHCLVLRNFNIYRVSELGLENKRLLGHQISTFKS